MTVSFPLLSATVKPTPTAPVSSLVMVTVCGAVVAIVYSGAGNKVNWTVSLSSLIVSLMGEMGRTKLVVPAGMVMKSGISV